MTLRAEVYTETLKTTWDNFIRQSKNGVFLFLRDYMDYHRDRFPDHSLLIWNERNQLVAVLPACCSESVLTSHAGLTYGGFITGPTMSMPKMLEVFETALAYLQQHAFSRLVYKTVPYIQHQWPAEEDRYALFLCQAHIVRRGVLTVVDSRQRLPFETRRLRGLKKARQNGLTVAQTDRWPEFWIILTERLRKAYQTRPVHNLEEIELLRQRFPDNIKLFACFQQAVMLGGVVIYESARVAHAQYIAASDLGWELGALDLVFNDLLLNQYASKPFFDFGTSDEKNGQYLNRGLIEQKEGFGARVVVHDHFEIQLAHWRPGRLTGVMHES